MAIESVELFAKVTTSMALLSENGWRLCGGPTGEEAMVMNSRQIGGQNFDTVRHQRGFICAISMSSPRSASDGRN
jgi:hypothetical protein